MTGAVVAAGARERFREWIGDRENLAALIIAAFAAAVLAMRQSYRVPLTDGMSLSRAAACFGVVVVVIGVLAGNAYCRSMVRRIPLWPTLIALGVLAAAFLSAAHASTGEMDLTQMTLTGYALRDAITATAAFLVIVTFIRRTSSIVIVLRGFVIGGAISSLFGLVTYVTGADLAPMLTLPGLRYDATQLVTDLTRDGVVRPQGSAGHPLELSSVLTILVPVAVALAFEARRRQVRWWPWAVATVILVVGAGSTVSRSALVGMAIAVAVFALCWPPRRAVIAVAAVVAAIGIAALARVPMVTQLITVSTSGSNDGSLQSRAVGRDYAADRFGLHMWLGQGTGTYDVRVQPVLDNDYLAQLLQVGLIGVAAMLIFYALGVCSGVAAVVRSRRAGDRSLREIAPALLAGVLIVVVIAAILDIGGFAQVSLLSTALVALSVCAARASRSSRSTVTTAMAWQSQ